MATQHAKSPCCRGSINRFGKRRYRIRSSNLRDKILEATRVILGSRNDRVLQQDRRNILTLINRPVCPPYIRKQALEFLELEQDFQTYLRYPSLRLPTTTSAIESTGEWYAGQQERRAHCNLQRLEPLFFSA